MRPSAGRVAWVATALLVGVGGLLGHRWVALGWNAARYPVAVGEERSQAVVVGAFAYVASGTAGIEVVDLSTGSHQAFVTPMAPLDRVDDLAAADGMLFALDATAPGHLTTYSLAEAGRPVATGATAAVPVGPFSGVSAASGLVVVSGGTSEMTLRSYDATGMLGAEVAVADFGRGQPDVALRNDPELPLLAAISTHLVGPDFAITLAEIRRSPLSITRLSEIPLDGAGFTAGGFKPAHFPIVSAWRGNLLYVTHGGGLWTIDVTDPRSPVVVARDASVSPAQDLAVSGDRLDVLTRNQIVRFQLDGAGLLSPISRWDLPQGSPASSIVGFRERLFLTRREGWQVLSR